MPENGANSDARSIRKESNDDTKLKGAEQAACTVASLLRNVRRLG
jgi:hypothetical protein